MKKILILGVGAQGTTVAQRLDEMDAVAEIICADYDEKAVNNLVNTLTKAKGMKVDATNKADIVRICEGVDLMVNALPLEFGPNAIEAAIDAKVNYQDFAGMEGIREDWVEGTKVLKTEYSEKFKENGKIAILGTGSAPGLICVVTKKAMEYLDTCDTIYNCVYEGVEAKRFQPFWWSPVTALEDMCQDAHSFENGEFVRNTPFSKPIKRKYDYLKEVTLVEHEHEEPLFYGLNADTHFKGAKNIFFKYGGAGATFAEPLYRAGLLSRTEKVVEGEELTPFQVILAHLPPAPKYKEELAAIIEEGLVSDEGCMVIEATGEKDGKETYVEIHVFAPGMEEAFELAGLSGEMYLTGQGGFMFTKMFVEDKFDQKGLITSDMLDEKQVETYIEEMKKLGITLDIKVETK